MVMKRRTGKWGKVQAWMKAQVLQGEYVVNDNVQLTKLGEAAMHEFNLGDDDQNEVDDLAFEVSEWFENRV
jgi:hypothetical protein